MQIRDRLNRSFEVYGCRFVTYRQHNFTSADKETLKSFIRTLPANDPIRIRFEARGLTAINNTYDLILRLSQSISQN